MIDKIIRIMIVAWLIFTILVMLCLPLMIFKISVTIVSVFYIVYGVYSMIMAIVIMIDICYMLLFDDII